MSSNTYTPALPLSEQIVQMFWRLRWQVARAVWQG